MKEAVGKLNDPVIAIQATASAFVAIKCTGELVTWGCPESGGALRLPHSGSTGNQVRFYLTTRRGLPSLMGSTLLGRGAACDL